MKSLESGKDKIQKICDALRKETLEPAKQEAAEIVENAHLQAESIIREAKEQVKGLIENAEKEIDQKQKAFQGSLQLACRQGIELLKQKIEQEMLFRELADYVVKEMADPNLIANMVNGFMKSVEEKGLEEDISAVIPRSIAPRAVNCHLIGKFIERLKEKSVVLGEFAGGAQIKLRDRQITIDVSDRVVRELIGAFIRRDFRDLVFRV